MSSSLEALLELSGKTSLDELKRAKGLLLGDRGLTSLPESIGRLTNLTVLGLGGNKLSSLPESMGRLTNLTWLSLYSNQLSSLPEFIGKLTNLTYLSVSDNQITELPESITRLKNLKKLQIEVWGRMTIQRAPIGITALPCYSNSGKWDDSELSCSDSLKKLKFYSNHISENLTDISSLIGKWKACDCINISNNKISTLPNQLSTLTGLCDFNISNNMFAMFPDVLLKMSWLTSLNIAGNSFTELPEGITKLAKLASLDIEDSNGMISIQRAPANITTLPCYHANSDLKKLTPHPTQFPFLSIRQRLNFSATHNIDGLVEKKNQQESAPVLAPSKIEATDASAFACKKGTLCVLCLKPFFDPCTLECGHIFCSTCVVDATQESRIREPFGCPTCHKPVLKSIEISEKMTTAAQSAKLEADSVAEEIFNPFISTPMCKYSRCQEMATHRCAQCGNFCPKHLESHDDVNEDHIEFVSEIIPGTIPTSAKPLCPVHKALEVKYYCAECQENPFKCVECLADDHQTIEGRLHKFIQFRGVDSEKFKDLLTDQLARVNSKIRKVKNAQTKIDTARMKFYESLDETKYQARQFLDDVKTLVNQLETNINMQLDNLEKEYKRELDHKYNEFHADEARLELSQWLISEAVETFLETSPTELGNIMKFSRDITSLPTKEPELHKMTTDKLPRDLLSQLKTLNRQLMFGLYSVASSSQNFQPDSAISPMQIQSFVFDQASEQYFGIDEERTEVIATSKKRKVIRKIPAHSFVEGGVHSLQGISASTDGVLAVADLFANTVTLYDMKTLSVGLVLRDYGDARDCLFNSPCDVAFDSQGRLFVVDSGSRSVIVFDEHFAFSRRVDVANVGSDLIEGIPRMVEIGSEGRIFIYLAGSNSILEFDKDLNFIRGNVL